MKKNKKKTSVNTKLKVFQNIKETLKYYFKNILYILGLNILIFSIFETFFARNYSMLVSKFFDLYTTNFYIIYNSLILLVFFVFKSIFFSNIINNQKNNTSNSLLETFGISFKRFFSVFGTTVFFLITITFFGLFLILPGILFFFYYFFSIYLCAIGDTNNRSSGGTLILHGIKAFGRSYNLVKGNLFRFIFMTIIVAVLIYFSEKSIISYIADLHVELNLITKNIIINSIYDLAIIYTILIFLNLQKIESEIRIEEDAEEAETRALLMSGTLQNKERSGKK
ncbi:MAG TPA: hypothetical protein VLL98_04195 [Rickettsiales bacterium]|nr:hypothetical protein [Rickettsiales bacterium]